MNFKIGDRVIYEEKDMDGKDLQGKIIAVAVNNVEMMTTSHCWTQECTFNLHRII